MTETRMQAFRAALRESAPVGFGYISLGMAFGLYAVSQGFHWWWATFTALIVYAGSMEFLLVGLVLSGTSLIQVAASTLFVNFRHIFYGISAPIKNCRNPLARLYGVHALTDEAYALLSNPKCREYSGPRIFFIQLFCHIYWVGGVTAGALIGSVIPYDLSWMGFALTALFVALTIDVVKASAKPVPLLIIGLLCALVALIIVPKYMMVASMTSYAIIAVIARRWLR